MIEARVDQAISMLEQLTEEKLAKTFKIVLKDEESSRWRSQVLLLLWIMVVLSIVMIASLWFLAE